MAFRDPQSLIFRNAFFTARWGLPCKQTIVQRRCQFLSFHNGAAINFRTAKQHHTSYPLKNGGMPGSLAPKLRSPIPSTRNVTDTPLVSPLTELVREHAGPCVTEQTCDAVNFRFTIPHLTTSRDEENNAEESSRVMFELRQMRDHYDDEVELLSRDRLASEDRIQKLETKAINLGSQVKQFEGKVKQLEAEERVLSIQKRELEDEFQRLEDKNMELESDLRDLRDMTDLRAALSLTGQ